MIHALSGILVARHEQWVAVRVGTIDLKLFVSKNAGSGLSALGGTVSFFTTLYWREDVGPELYGFLTEEERELFQKFIGISGIGPKSALAILGVAKFDQLVAAINEGRVELLTHASGVGKKTAERIILELKGKLDTKSAPQTLALMESDAELEDTLVGLGYSRNDARRAIGRIDPAVKGFKERLKAALKKEKTS